MISHLIDPAILGFILVGVMLFAIFVGFPISFTLIFLGFVFGYLGFGKLVFYLMTLQFSMVMTEQTLAAVPLFVFSVCGLEFGTGGFVSGPGGVDQVPAKLTAGEFVMSKGAVQKYGANTLAAMNAAGGGTNIPTLMGGKPGYEGGGLVTVPKGKINSYQDAIDAGIEVEDTVAMVGKACCGIAT